MVDMSYDDKYRLIDEYYLENNINEILSLNEYVPSILISVMNEIYVDPKVYSQWKDSISKENNKPLWSMYIKQKSIRQSLAWKGTGILGLVLELLIFLVNHDQFRGVIKDEDYLEEIINDCEEEYDINIIDYINTYEDMRRLLKDLEE